MKSPHLVIGNYTVREPTEPTSPTNRSRTGLTGRLGARVAVQIDLPQPSGGLKEEVNHGNTYVLRCLVTQA